MDELVKYLKALVYLQARMVSAQEDGPKAEVVLANAGLSYREIAEALDKTEQAVAKAVSRSRSGAKKKGKIDE